MNAVVRLRKFDRTTLITGFTMTRSLAFVLAVTIGFAIFASMGAKTNLQNSNPFLLEFGNKVLLFDRANWSSTISKDVRLVQIGDDTFFVYPNPMPNIEKFDYWVPLDKIENIRVFNNEEDATSYDKKVNAYKYKPVDTSK